MVWSCFQAMTVPEMPLLVSHITTRQGRSFVCALGGGHPDASETIARSARHEPETFLPAR